ncbi:hypothetical protein [Streptomyces sp. SID13031]|uniref:hypothetical protein n=1 Tax=Streptomyces sp. SID13031 TaxID=2706046 RepID=UPI0013CC9904|nr:hypothetical protein [Streptomyces sp. SID13031]NEA34321.1 hypothetical protein [Streptomyces sp. SID13031]
MHYSRAQPALPAPEHSALTQEDAVVVDRGNIEREPNRLDVKVRRTSIPLRTIITTPRLDALKPF